MYSRTRAIWSSVDMRAAQSTVRLHTVEPRSREILSDEMLVGVSALDFDGIPSRN